jgi:hypothetical protein
VGTSASVRPRARTAREKRLISSIEVMICMAGVRSQETEVGNEKSEVRHRSRVPDLQLAPDFVELFAQAG